MGSDMLQFRLRAILILIWVTLYLANLKLKTFFHKMFAKKRESECKFFRNFHTTVWKLLRFILTLFWQKFRESNDFTKKLI